MKPNAETISAMVEAEIARQQRRERKQQEREANNCPVIPSREQRLAELLAEFEATLLRFYPNYKYPICPDAVIRRIHEGWLEIRRDWPPEEDGIFPIYQPAARYIIARDFNEFDPGKADMLWKLQNGGAV